MIKCTQFIMLFYCCVCFSMEKNKNKESSLAIINTLLLNPQLINKHCMTLRQEIDNEINDIVKTYFPDLEKIPMINEKSHKILDFFGKCIGKINTYRLKHPLIYIAECDEKECFFNRKEYPERRSFFEKVLVSDLLSKIKNNHLVCTSFASGKLFQDLVIASRVLTHYPSLHLTLHAIDKNYVPYNPYQSKNLSNIIQDKNICDRNSHIYTEYHNFLSTTFPSASVVLFMYSSVESYIHALESIPTMQHADYVYAIDIEGNQSLDCYRWLCTKTLHHNPNSTNMLCNHAKNQLTLHTMALACATDSQENNLHNINRRDIFYTTAHYSI